MRNTINFNGTSPKWLPVKLKDTPQGENVTNRRQKEKVFVSHDYKIN